MSVQCMHGQPLDKKWKDPVTHRTHWAHDICVYVCIYKRRKRGKKEEGGREREREKKRRLKSWQTLSLALAKDREALISLASCVFPFFSGHLAARATSDSRWWDSFPCWYTRCVEKNTRFREISPAITNVSSGDEKRWKIRNIIFVENTFLRGIWNVSLILDRISLKFISIKSKQGINSGFYFK